MLAYTTAFVLAVASLPDECLGSVMSAWSKFGDCSIAYMFIILTYTESDILMPNKRSLSLRTLPIFKTHFIL